MLSISMPCEGESNKNANWEIIESEDGVQTDVFEILKPCDTDSSPAMLCEARADLPLGFLAMDSTAELRLRSF
jgi:hypothetical protein